MRPSSSAFAFPLLPPTDDLQAQASQSPFQIPVPSSVQSKDPVTDDPDPDQVARTQASRSFVHAHSPLEARLIVNGFPSFELLVAAAASAFYFCFFAVACSSTLNILILRLILFLSLSQGVRDYPSERRERKNRKKRDSITGPEARRSTPLLLSGITEFHFQDPGARSSTNTQSLFKSSN
jgi:hypothetical protein